MVKVLVNNMGLWLYQHLKLQLDNRLREATVHGNKLTTKYVDPSYMVCDIPPNMANDLQCLQLAHNSVHKTMREYSSFVLGLINTSEC